MIGRSAVHRIKLSPPFLHQRCFSILNFQDDSLKDYQSSTNNNKFDSVLARSIQDIKKKLRSNPEIDKIEQLHSLMVERSFDIDHKTDPDELRLSKDGPNLERIIVKIWEVRDLVTPIFF
jgi:hypothetical protein